MPLDNAPPSSLSQPWDKSYPAGLHWNSEIPQTTLAALFDESVRKYQDLTCLNFMGKKISYKEVGEMVDHFAKGLQDRGIGKGSRVGLCLPNTPFYVIAYYGALKAGATIANFDPTAPADALAQQIDDSKTDVLVAINLTGTEKQPLYPNVEKALTKSSLKKIIVCDMADSLTPVKGLLFKVINAVCDITDHKLLHQFNKKARDFRDKKGVKPVAHISKDDRHLSFRKILNSHGSPKTVTVKPEDTVLLQYTGGTTGVPKGAELTNANLTANINQCANWFTQQPEKVLAVLPFFHVFSMTSMMNLSIFNGSEIIIMAEPDMKKMLGLIESEKPTIFAGVPTLYKKMCDYPDIDQYDLSSLRMCISGGASLPETTLAAFKKLTGLELIEGYGLSETSPVVTANPVNGLKKPGSIGLPVQGLEVKFTDIDHPEKTLEFGQEGEICVRGPQVMKGYFGKPEETAHVFDKDGFFHTGDIGMMDKDGYVFITDRLKDMIIVNGLKAFPKKIEEAIRQFDGVSEVIVIGVPDADTGEAVKAFIQPKPGKTIDPDALVSFLKGHLKHYELPRARNIEFREELPLTKIGKPDKKALREQEKTKAANKNRPQL